MFSARLRRWDRLLAQALKGSSLYKTKWHLFWLQKTVKHGLASGQIAYSNNHAPTCPGAHHHPHPRLYSNLHKAPYVSLSLWFFSNLAIKVVVVGRQRQGHDSVTVLTTHGTDAFCGKSRYSDLIFPQPWRQKAVAPSLLLSANATTARTTSNWFERDRQSQNTWSSHQNRPRCRVMAYNSFLWGLLDFSPSPYRVCRWRILTMELWDRYRCMTS
jgi:hypothetical protein